MRAYGVFTGEFDGTTVTYDLVVAFTTRRVAETVVRKARKDDPYTHQYDKVEAIPVYATEGAWSRGVKMRAKRRTGTGGR